MSEAVFNTVSAQEQVEEAQTSVEDVLSETVTAPASEESGEGVVSETESYDVVEAFPAVQEETIATADQSTVSESATVTPPSPELSTESTISVSSKARTEPQRPPSGGLCGLI